MRWSILLLLITSALSYEAKSLEDISFKNVSLGDKRIELKKTDFNVKSNIKIPSNKYQILVDADSLQWVRIKKSFLIPRVKISIKLQGLAEDYLIKYKDHTLSLQKKEKYASLQFYYSLFDDENVKLYKNGKPIGHFSILINEHFSHKKAHLIDYSCSRNKIRIEGIDKDLLSVGCRTKKSGKIGSEKATLEVIWASANYKSLGQDKRPYLSTLTDENPTKITVVNKKGERKIITISAYVPKRIYRLNTALGLGPYAFETSFNKNLNSSSDKIQYKSPLSPAVMLYFNFKISKDISIRGFDAHISDKSTFNNAGGYLANNIAYLLDNKLIITTLLGAQYLYFNFDKDHEKISEPIYPQGVEFLYKHAFDIENYIISGGLFLSPSSEYDYQNIWIRWGKNYFWELNYIFWGKDRFNTSTYGLSIGFPLARFF